MLAKKYKSPLFLALMVSLAHALCCVPFLIFFDKRVLFSLNNQVHPAKIQFLVGGLCLSAATGLVFVLIKNQVRQAALLQSQLELADGTIEIRVKLRTAELEKSLDSLRTLKKGIIPICAHCKSIRNGSEEWESIEAYFQQRTEAKFSHGLCPECENALYGDIHQHFKSIASKYS